MDIRNGLITAYAGISASVGASSGISFYKSTGSYFNLFNNGRLWIGSGTPVDAGYQMDIVGASRVTGNWTITNGSLYAPNTNYLQLSSYAAATDRNFLIGYVGANNLNVTGSYNLIVGAGLNTNFPMYTGSYTLNAGTYIAGTQNTIITAGGSTLTSATASNAVIIGNTNWNYIGAPTINNSIILGNGFYAGANWSMDRSVYIGHTAPLGVTVQQFIGINSSLNSTENNTMAIGNTGYVGSNSPVRIDNVYFNNGNLTGYPAAPVIINAGKAATGSTNIAGVNITIAGGKGTGNAAPGDVVFSTPTSTGSGILYHTLVDRWYVKANTGTFTNRNTLAATSYSLDVSGSSNFSGSVYFTGSVFMSPSSSFVLPLSASTSPLTGSAYWSGNFLFVWNGLKYVSSSFA